MVSVLEYRVTVYDYVKNITIEDSEFSDANTAYHHFRAMSDHFVDQDTIVVRLNEPE